MDQLKVDVSNYLQTILYSDKCDKDKEIAYDNLRKKALNLNCSQNEKDYIISQLCEIPPINVYNIAYISLVCKRFIERYNAFYGLDIHSDLDHLRLIDVTRRLFNRTYLTNVIDYKDEFVETIGYKYGPQDRILLCMPIRHDIGTTKWCTFILDTGSANNYISDQTAMSLGIDVMNSSAWFYINSIRTKVYPSHDDSRLMGVNLLGNSFLESFNSTLTIKHKEGDCNIQLSRNV